MTTQPNVADGFGGTDIVTHVDVFVLGPHQALVQGVEHYGDRLVLPSCSVISSMSSRCSVMRFACPGIT